MCGYDIEILPTRILLAPSSVEDTLGFTRLPASSKDDKIINVSCRQELRKGNQHGGVDMLEENNRP